MDGIHRAAPPVITAAIRAPAVIGGPVQLTKADPEREAREAAQKEFMERLSGVFGVTMGDAAGIAARIKEIGAATLALRNGIVGEEWQKDLLTLSGRCKKYDEMRFGVPTGDTAMKVLEMPLLTATYDAESAGDEFDDLLAAELLRFNMFSTMSVSWKECIAHAALCLQYGVSPMEIVDKQEDWAFEIEDMNGMVQRRVIRGAWMWRKWAWRPPGTIYRWKYDDEGGIAGFKQRGYFPRGMDSVLDERDIDIDRLLLFVNGRRGADYEGKSVMRSMYRDLKILDFLLKLEPIAFERFCMGIPFAKYPKDATVDEISAMRLILQYLQGNQEQCMTFRDDWDVGMIEMQIRNLTFLANSLKAHEMSAYRVALAPFLGLGSDSVTGSRSVGEVQVNFFLEQENGIADNLCETPTRYEVPRLIRRNVKTLRLPSIGHSRIGTTDPLGLASALGELISKGALTHDTDLENEIRRLLGVPPKAGEEEGAQSAEPEGGGQEVKTSPEGEEKTAEQKEPSGDRETEQAVRSRRAIMVRGRPYYRAINRGDSINVVRLVDASRGERLHCLGLTDPGPINILDPALVSDVPPMPGFDYISLARDFDAGEKAFMKAARALTEKQQKVIEGIAEEALAAGRPADLAWMEVPYKEEYQKLLSEFLMKTFLTGAKQVAKEADAKFQDPGSEDWAEAKASILAAKHCAELAFRIGNALVDVGIRHGQKAAQGVIAEIPDILSVKDLQAALKVASERIKQSVEE